MNKTINFLTTSTLSILVMQFCVFGSKPAVAQTYNESADTEFFAQGASVDDSADNSENGDFTVEDEIRQEAPYDDSAETEEFYEEGASADDEANSNDEANSSETNNSEADGDVTVEDELRQEAPYNESAETELFYEEGASAEDKADKSTIDRDRTKGDDRVSDDEIDEEKTNPPQGLNSEDIKIDRELETEAESFEQNSAEEPRIEDVRQPDTSEDSLPAESPLDEADL